MKLKEFLYKRIQRIALMITMTTKKIVKKELKGLKKDIIKGMK